ncbi:MAG TPA: M1 family metallopeptidase, partial [Patescibacteria group bacterium]|nr:M1 family metallopeptidase [Patescibacteria group bacterium]
LYLNAFKNDRTTFMKESGGVNRGNRAREGGWGYTDILSMRSSADGADLMAGAEFVRPDDGNPEDETVLRVPLPVPVQPGATIALELEFEARLPRVFARTGYKGDFHLVGQWFPKLGVLQESGWNCHQFHNHSEFFADFGTFDVAITVPSAYVVGATGSLAGAPAPGADGTTTYHYLQDDVHDFAWTADTRFIKEVRWFRFTEQRDVAEEKRMARALGIPPDSESLELGDVEVTLLIHPEHRALIDRHFDAVFNGLKYFGYWYGRYPYRTLTVVDPAFGARGAGGMEYPTFITAGASYLSPAARWSPEGVTVHEFGHQYWYAMVANNEFEEAFLDEGFNSYSTGRVMEKAYGPNRDSIDVAPGVPYLAVPLLEIPRGPDPLAAQPAPQALSARLFDLALLRPFGPSDDVALNTLRDLPFLNDVRDAPIDETTSWRRRYLKGPKADNLARRSWEYLDTEVYGLNSYARTALMLKTLEGILGEDLMLRTMRTYFERYRFKHPGIADFISTVNDVAGRSLDAYFAQAVFGSDVMDYSVTELSSRPARPGRGLFGPPADRKTVTQEQVDHAPAGDLSATATLRDKALIRRLGEFVWPQEIELRYDQGPSSRRSWDGAYRWIRYDEDGPRLAAARIDPESKMALDVNQSNNSRTREANPLAGITWWCRLLQWMQHVAYFYSGIS